MPKPRRRCIFCGGWGLTEEHVIPDWVQQIIPKEPHQGQKFTINTSVESNLPPNSRPRHEWSRVRQGHPISRKVKVVCRVCNNGWMCDLEEEMKPLIKTLATGKCGALTMWEQRRLAMWASKTAMTAEFMHPKTAAITFEERERLRLHRDAPPNFYVWIGHYDGDEYAASLHHHSVEHSVRTPARRKGRVTPNTQTTLIVLGRLFLQIGSSSFPGLQFNLKENRLRRIWPARSADLLWPPPAVNDAYITNLLLGINRAFKETI